MSIFSKIKEKYSATILNKPQKQEVSFGIIAVSCIICNDDPSLSHNMKYFQLVVLGFFLNTQSYGQTISGAIIDDADGTPLIYASIGVIETTVGTVTSEKGDFLLDVKNLPSQSTVRISMIGYKSRTFTIDQLLNKKDTIRLSRVIYHLPEIVVNQGGKLITFGNKTYSRSKICGWGGNNFGKGWEIGTRFNLDDSPKRIKSLHIRINKQSFDSSLFRIHIRDIVESLPQNELLRDNILIAITKESGWITIDLSNYHLVFEGEIALTMEWIKVIGLNKDKLLSSMNKSFPAVTLNTKQNKGVTYTKWGTEAKWISHTNGSPCIYITAQ